MADSLDDFFAKKDKKRGKDKGKSAVFSAEALVRELEEGSKQVDYPVRKDNKTSTAIELLGLDADDADWRDFEDVEKRDYTGLKVKEMSLQDQNEEEQRRLSAEQSDLMPESTPWKMRDEQASANTTDSISNAKQKPAPSASATTTNTNTTATNTNTTGKATNSSAKSETEEKSNSMEKTMADEKVVDSKIVEKSSDPPEEKSDKKPSAVYVPRQQRLVDSEVQKLEPVRLGKMKPSSTRQGHIPNIQDEQAFPSLG